VEPALTESKPTVRLAVCRCGHAPPQLRRTEVADHQISGLCHIDTSFGQSCDDTDRPRMSGGPTTAENQSNVFNHLPTISARGQFCPSK
jgi:hypothetical protein